MVNEIEKMQAQFERFSQILSCENENIMPPIEVIDFDLLLETIQGATVLLGQVMQHIDQMDSVCEWFISRIKGYSRAEAAILKKSIELPKDMDRKGPIELLHQYEAAAARMRRLCNSGGKKGGSSLRADMKEYDIYKS